jgi:hypothetical protein
MEMAAVPVPSNETRFFQVLNFPNDRTAAGGATSIEQKT